MLNDHLQQLSYTANYIRQLLDGTVSADPNYAHLNGYGDPLAALVDAYRLGGDEAVYQMLENLQPTHPELYDLICNPTIIPFEALTRMPRPKWLIDHHGIQIQEESVALLYGPTGIGKSFIALDLALAVAMEHPMIYIAGEGLSTYRERYMTWRATYGIPEYNYICREAVNLLDPGAMAWFYLRADAIMPRLIVVDTLAMSMAGGEENSAKDMGLVLQACKAMQRRYQATILLIHHAGKAGGSPRGSNALESGCDTVIAVERVREGDAIALKCQKQKAARAFPTVVFRFETVTLDDPDPDAEEPISCLVPVVEGAIVSSSTVRLNPAQRQILTCLLNHGDGLSVADLIDKTGMQRPQVNNALASLKARELVVHPQRGNYQITAEGEDALQP